MQRSNNEQYVIGAISNLSNRFARFADSTRADITFKQWYLLMMISRMEEEPRNVRDIAEFAGTSRQNVKKMLASLEAKGYVTCSKSESDGRALDVELTHKAYKYFEREGADAEARIEELFEPLTDAELAGLVSSILKLSERLDELEGIEE